MEPSLVTIGVRKFNTALRLIRTAVNSHVRVKYPSGISVRYTRAKKRSIDLVTEKWVNRHLLRVQLAPNHTELLIAFDDPYSFFAVSFHDQTGQHYHLHRPDPDRLPTILHDLHASPILAKQPFLQAFGKAIQREAFDAFEGWYSWLTTENDTSPFIVKHFLDNKAELRYKRATALLNPLGSDNPKVKTLEKMWLAFKAFSWQSDVRFGVLEGAAIALGKYYGSLGNYERALYYVEAALSEPRLSIHLKTASHTLHLCLEGKPVPPRLARFAGPDNGYLKDFVCDMPFKRFDIVETGEVNVCCGHWLPTPVGNIETDSLDHILNSEKAKAIRKSMTDGSYKYCNQLECVHLAQNIIPRKETVQDPIIDQAIANDNFGVTHVDNLLFSYDQSCNLACPSCRKERIIEKPSQNEEKARIVETKLMPLLSKLRHLEINVAGEVFVSKPSRQMLSMISQETCPDLQIDMISNGMLFTEKEWNKFPGIHGKVSGVRISIDAARKETFEVLRRFGIHEVLLENLAFLKRLRQEKAIGGLTLSFTYQLGNFREMEEFVHFARRYGADKIIFEPLQNVGAFTAKEYTDRAVHRAEHPLFQEFLAMIKRPIFKMVGIQHDFANYESFSDTDLFISQPYIPVPAQCRLEGIDTRLEDGETAFFASPTLDHHRVMLRDTGTYSGLYRFSIEVKPIHAHYIGIEIHSMNMSDYESIIFDTKLLKATQAKAVSQYSSDISIEPGSNGMLKLSFNFCFNNPSGTILNIFHMDDVHRIEYKSTGSEGMVIGPIRAIKQSDVHYESAVA